VEGRWTFSATTPCHARSRTSGIVTQPFFCQVLTQARIPHDREVDIAGNGRRRADVLLTAWDGRRDLEVDLTIVHPNRATDRPLRDSAATFLKDKGEQKNRESADSCERMGVDFSPMVFDPCGGFHVAGNVVKAIFARCTASLLPGAHPVAVGALSSHRTTGPLSGPAAAGSDDGGDGDADMVGSRTSDRPLLHGGGQPAVVSRGMGQPRPWHTAGLLTSPHRALILWLLNLLTYHGLTTMPTGPGGAPLRKQAPPPTACRPVLCTCYLPAPRTNFFASLLLTSFEGDRRPVPLPNTMVTTTTWGTGAVLRPARH